MQSREGRYKRQQCEKSSKRWKPPPQVMQFAVRHQDTAECWQGHAAYKDHQICQGQAGIQNQHIPECISVMWSLLLEANM